MNIWQINITDIWINRLSFFKMMDAWFAPQQIANDLRNPTLISFVDMARWMAAAMVMIGHLRNPIFFGYSEQPAGARSIAVTIWFFITGYHAEAVLVFFVLSGFLVGGLTMARQSADRFDSGSYAIDRISRLFIAYLPALLLTLVLTMVGSAYFNSTGMYDGTHPMIVQKVQGIAFENNISIPIIVGNLMMLQTFFVPELGSNPPLWSLSFEFWFYAIFGLALTGVTKLRFWRFLLIGTAGAIALVLGAQFVLHFGLWLLGLGTAGLKPRRLGHPLVAAVVLSAWLLVIRIFDARLDASEQLKMSAHYVLAVLFGWLIMTFRGRNISAFVRLQRANKFMADFSYSLYLTHFPVLIFVMAVLGQLTDIAGFKSAFAANDGFAVTLYVAMIAFLLGFAWCFAQITEKNTAKLRYWLRGRLLTRTSPASKPET